MIEKELGIFIAEQVNSLPDSGDNFKDCFTLAKAIIARYPQITKKPVKINIFETSDKERAFIEFFTNTPFFQVRASIFLPTHEKNAIEERQEWIDQHYVEVVE